MTRRAPWEDIVDADLEMHAKGRVGQGRRFLVGLLTIGVGTFIAAFYVPLHRAHRALSAEYSTTAEQSLRAQSELVHLREERDRLRQESETRMSAGAAAKARADRLGKELAGSFEKLTKRGVASVATTESTVLFVLDPAFLFAPQGTAVSVAGRKTLCETVGAAGRTAVIHVHDSLTEGAAVPAAFAKDYPSAWAFTAARAAGVAQALEENCGLVGAALRVSGDANQERFAPALSAAKGERLVLEITVPK